MSLINTHCSVSHIRCCALQQAGRALIMGALSKHASGSTVLHIIVQIEGVDVVLCRANAIVFKDCAVIILCVPKHMENIKENRISYFHLKGDDQATATSVSKANILSPVLA